LLACGIMQSLDKHFKVSSRITLFLLSAATLLFEINLPRLFSVAQFYHFAFMIVSLALLGFGASGTLLTIFPGLSRQPDRNLRWLAFCTWVGILGAYLITNWIPFDSFRLASDVRQIFFLFFHYLSLTTPFIFSGMATGLLLKALPNKAGQVYAWNLIGSAVGCLLALYFPRLLGGEGTVIVSACLALSGTVFSYRFKGKKILQIILPVFSTCLLFLSCAFLWLSEKNEDLSALIELKLSPYKSLSYALQYPGAEIVYRDWNAFSRVDVVQSAGIRSLPGVSYLYPDPPPVELGLFVDGDNMSPIVFAHENLSFTSYLPIALAFQLHPGAETLILEPRGGLDVLIALNEGAEHVTAIEANELIVAQAEHIYNHQDVETVIEIDRSYLRRSREVYDLIIFSLTDSYHPVRSGAYSLAEDYRYTIEAFQDAISRLSPDGILVISRWLQTPPSEWLRSFILAATILRDMGMVPEQQIIAYRSFNIGVLLIKKIPFTEEELGKTRSFASERAYDLVTLPGIAPDEVNKYAVYEEPFYYQTFSGFLAAASPEEWLNAYPYDVSPLTDDHPFFGHYFKWSQTRQIIAELGKIWQPFGGAGYFVVLVMLVLAFVLALILIVFPLLFGRRAASVSSIVKLPRQIVLTNVAYFSFIGLAYLFIEIPLIQQFILFLGHPTYALTSVLFSILLFSGIGSQVSDRVKPKLALACLIVVVLLVLFLLPIVIQWALGFTFLIRMLISMLILSPLGLLMGMPFPNGIRKIGMAVPEIIPWVWGINGATSVIASILAMLVALSSGFRWVFILGALFYTGAWVVTPYLGVRR
jgi:hypothetical protein